MFSSRLYRVFTFTTVLFFWLISSVFATENDHLTFPSLASKFYYDVDEKLHKKLTKQERLVEVQRMFEIQAWQWFIKLNTPSFSTGKLEWESWKESYEVYKEDGSKPSKWGVRDLPPDFTLSDDRRVLFRTNRMDLRNIANVDDEINQAFTAPIWDRNGNAVRYEVLMNQVEFDYIVKNQIYNYDGQIAFSKKNKALDFPEATRSKPGAVELKLAWRILDPEKDIASRYLSMDAYVINEDKVSYSPALVGLVGMHISVKTKTAPQWIWSTFEQVDNLRTNRLKSVDGKQLLPTFNDPNCEICPVNVYPNLDGDYTNNKIDKATGEREIKNQIQRIIPITKETAELNAYVQELLGGIDSVLQYYELIGAQWPTDPSAKPYDVTKHNANYPPTLPDAVTNKSGGKPMPVYLTNMTMETYFQGASLTLPNQIYNAGYNQELGNQAAWHQIQGFQSYGTNPNRIFGTESCMGCHYSAAIAVGEKIVDGKKTPIFGDPQSADFSWLPQLKAHFKTQ